MEQFIARPIMLAFNNRLVVFCVAWGQIVFERLSRELCVERYGLTVFFSGRPYLFKILFTWHYYLKEKSMKNKLSWCIIENFLKI